MQQMPDSSDAQQTIGDLAALACLLEVSAPKPGNVNRHTDFHNLTFYDFIASANAIRGPFDEAVDNEKTVGELVLSAVEKTQAAVQTNTNLGIILLLAPLAKVPLEKPLDSKSVAAVLSNLDANVCAQVYQAIAKSNPGGMGEVDESDVNDKPPSDLIEAMRLAEDRDKVAFQYTNDFSDLFEFVVPVLKDEYCSGRGLIDSIIWTYLKTLAQFPDSLIARKCGNETSNAASAMASQAISARANSIEAYHAAMADLDFWLRADSNRRNPGTTADLVTAGLFVVLREGIIQKPFKF